MADAERKIIPVTGRQALQYVEAIEGLIFDPQPYRGPEIKASKNAHTKLLELSWLNLSRKTEVSTPDPVKANLRRRYGNAISSRFYELTQGTSETDPEGENREFVYGSPLYKINERPSLLLDAGETRKYQVDLQLVRDHRWLIVYSFLHLQQAVQLHPEVPQPEANLMLCGPDMMRVQRDGKYGERYTPSFVEQQRLLTVNELLRKHMQATWPPTSVSKT